MCGDFETRCDGGRGSRSMRDWRTPLAGGEGESYDHAAGMASPDRAFSLGTGVDRHAALDCSTPAAPRSARGDGGDGGYMESMSWRGGRAVRIGERTGRTSGFGGGSGGAPGHFRALEVGHADDASDGLVGRLAWGRHHSCIA